jgi:TatD DNase family protein
LLVDVHTHLYEYNLEYIASLLSEKPIILVGVSDDYESSLKTIKLQDMLRGRVCGCIGLHPWEVKGKESVDIARHIVELALENNIKCLGEIGLDTKFVGETIEIQREVFKVFLEAARDYGLFLNLHTAGTWEEVLELLIRYDVPAANFHWYTGPLSLLKDIEGAGYTISINPAVKIQAKHRNVVKEAPISMLLTESDSPYEYKGLKLEPSMVEDVVREIALLKSLEEKYVREVIYNNFRIKVSHICL